MSAWQSFRKALQALVFLRPLTSVADIHDWSYSWSDLHLLLHTSPSKDIENDYFQSIYNRKNWVDDWTYAGRYKPLDKFIKLLKCWCLCWSKASIVSVNQKFFLLRQLPQKRRISCLQVNSINGVKPQSSWSKMLSIESDVSLNLQDRRRVSQQVLEEITKLNLPI